MTKDNVYKKRKEKFKRANINRKIIMEKRNDHRKSNSICLKPKEISFGNFIPYKEILIKRRKKKLWMSLLTLVKIFTEVKDQIQKKKC